MGAAVRLSTSYARVGDLSIAYEAGGAGDPALAFIYGVFQGRSYFARQQTHFSGRRNVVALDLRGHGESSAPREVTVEDFAVDMNQVNAMLDRFLELDAGPRAS